MVQVDLRDPQATLELVREVEPGIIFHLAADSSVPASYADPWETLENNIRGQLNLLEAVRKSVQSSRVLVVGSNEEYGAPDPDGLPLTEESPLRPGNPYAVSKVAQDLLGLQYYLAHGLLVIRARPFNHTGPGQSPRFVVPAFARQIARIEAGLQEPEMRVGNLAAGRDFSDARDIVRGYYLAVVNGQAGEVYNLASGRSRPIRDVLDALLSLSEIPIAVTTDPDLYRPVDVPEVFGSADKLYRATGWALRIPFEQTLADTLAYWRRKVQV
jgi:GDP-4-dehydro-6-deoxy-D-mannose reductase